MKSIKLIIFFIIFLFIISLSSYYYISKKYSLNYLIANFENNYKLNFILKGEPKFVYYPNFKLNFNGKLIKESANIIASNININLNKSYSFKPININIFSDSIDVEGLKLKKTKIKGDYIFFKNKYNLKSLDSKIGEGTIKLKGDLNFSKEKKFELNGILKNIHINQVLRQLKLANWERVEIKISSKNFQLSGHLDEENFFNNLKGSFPINGSMYFVTTEEERFGIAILNLLIDQIPKYKNLSQSLSQIINNFSDSPALINGALSVNEEKIVTKNLIIGNQQSKMNIKGSFDIKNNFFDAKLFFYESNNLIVEAKITGKLENPSIKILNSNNLLQDENLNNDLKTIFELGVENIIENILNLGN